ncbi:UNKNOWN [Stylonychia lemnae]|uniref:Uncharacterized protein n=1 Tax=Stylonychia lemnae TaxID=5949 RepID=A0A078A642_STYLE|nr:UNKNOWN [Stylonychia lemnae]|eukprot:CDW77025.1 UNKNOWN [Stylonychia lemnae]
MAFSQKQQLGQNYLSAGGANTKLTTPAQLTQGPKSNPRSIQSSNSQGRFQGSNLNANGKAFAYGTTQASGDAFSVRSHLSDMENTLSDIITEIKYHRQQVGMIKSEKETLESVLSMKIDDAKKTVQNEEKRVRNDMMRNKDNQHTETGRLHYQIKNLQVESNTMQQKLLGLQRRIQEMESHVGIHDDK